MDLVADLQAAGKEVLALYGSPHWLPPEHVLDAARSALSDVVGAPAQGLPALCEAAARKLARVNGIEVDPDQILVTNAANHGLSIVFSALLDPGDEVLTYSPHYYYQGLIELAGGVPTYAPTAEADGWRWNAEVLEQAISARTKMLVVNTPTNPTGYVASEQDLRAIAEIASRHDLLVVSDEAYDHTIYDDHRHLSIGALEGMGERTITVCSCTKSYAMRHWRIGFLATPSRLFPTLRKLLEWNCFQCNHIAQHAATAALEGPEEYIHEIGERFAQCRSLMLAGLEQAPGIPFAVPMGGPFLFVNGSRLPGGAAALRSSLLEHGVATDPGGPFGSADHLRLPFGGEAEDVREAARRISAVTQELLGGDG
jgi:aspartate aminotransferase